MSEVYADAGERPPIEGEEASRKAPPKGNSTEWQGDSIAIGPQWEGHETLRERAHRLIVTILSARECAALFQQHRIFWTASKYFKWKDLEADWILSHLDPTLFDAQAADPLEKVLVQDQIFIMELLDLSFMKPQRAGQYAEQRAQLVNILMEWGRDTAMQHRQQMLAIATSAGLEAR